MVHTTPTTGRLPTTWRPLVVQLSGALAQGVRQIDRCRHEAPTPQKMAKFAWELCAAGRGAESLTQSRGVRRETPGSSTYLRAKAGGDKSMSEKRESLEGVYGAVPQDPRDMVKATLPESQSPVVEPHTHRYHASDAVLSRACRSSFAVRTLRVMDDVQRAHSRG